MKRIVSFLLAVILVLGLCACSEPEKKKIPNIYEVELTKPVDIKEVDIKEFKVGLILPNTSETDFDKSLAKDFNSVATLYGVAAENVIIKYGVAFDKAAYTSAADLAKAGCQLVFAAASDYEDQMLEAAKDYKGVQFCVLGGTRAKTAKVGNLHSFYSSVYEARYFTGVAAGLKLKELVAEGKITDKEAKLGFVAAFDNAEAISAYTAFYLGAKSAFQKATLDVKFVKAYNNAEADKKAAKALIDGGCVILGHNTYSQAVPQACDEEKVYSIGYYGDTVALYPESSLISCSSIWESYFEFCFTAALNGEAISTDYTVSSDVGGAEVSAVNEAVAASGTNLYIKSARASILNNQLKIFDTDSFTVKGKNITSYLADVVDDGKKIKDSDAVANGCFYESAMRSAPYFDIKIDGINIKK